MPDPSHPDPPYYRVFLTIAEHPRRPLEGNRLALTGEMPDDLIDFEKLEAVYDEVADRYTLSDWATELYIGRLYLTETGNPVGVSWEDSPRPYEHGMGSNPVTDLPSDLTPVEEAADAE